LEGGCGGRFRRPAPHAGGWSRARRQVRPRYRENRSISLRAVRLDVRPEYESGRAQPRRGERHDCGGALTSAGVGPRASNSQSRHHGQHISESLVNQRVVAITTSIFGLIVLALAAVGLYGVVSCSVAQRTREIGIRRAGCRSLPSQLKFPEARPAVVPAIYGAGYGPVKHLAVEVLNVSDRLSKDGHRQRYRPLRRQTRFRGSHTIPLVSKHIRRLERWIVGHPKERRLAVTLG
jgi:hypothetical protein